MKLLLLRYPEMIMRSPVSEKVIALIDSIEAERPDIPPLELRHIVIDRHLDMFRQNYPFRKMEKLWRTPPKIVGDVYLRRYLLTCDASFSNATDFGDKEEAYLKRMGFTDVKRDTIRIKTRVYHVVDTLWIHSTKRK